MTHFYMVAVVPKDGLPENPGDESSWTSEAQSQLHETLNGLMARYDENMDMPEYEERCWCVGEAAKAAARNIAEEVVPLDTIRAKWRKAVAERHPDLGAKMERNGWDLMKAKYFAEKEDLATTDEEFLLDSIWEECFQEHKDAREAAEKAHLLYDKPDQKCDECNGTGVRTTTYNPESRWDWWVIGGRWDGAVSRTRKLRNHDQMGSNVVTVKWALENWEDDDIPLAILTPDGEWHERGKLGMFATYICPPHDPKEWREAARRILEYHPDHLIVGIDCHI